MRNLIKLSWLSVLGLIWVGCASGPKRSYQDVNQEVILDDRWSDTDNMKSAKDIIRQLMESELLKEQMVSGTKPVIGIEKVVNATDEIVDTNALVNYIKNELINSRKFKFVANDGNMRETMAKELQYQHGGNVKESDRKKIGQQTGLGHFLRGDLSSKVESDGQTKHVNYQLNMELIGLESGEVEWSGMYRLRKQILMN